MFDRGKLPQAPAYTNEWEGQDVSNIQFDANGFPVGHNAPPRPDQAIQVQYQAERNAEQRRSAYFRDAVGGYDQALGLMESYRPGGAATLASGIFQNRAQLLYGIGSQVQAPDMLAAYRENKADVAAYNSKSSGLGKLWDALGISGVLGLNTKAPPPVYNTPEATGQASAYGNQAMAGAQAGYAGAGAGQLLSSTLAGGGASAGSGALGAGGVSGAAAGAAAGADTGIALLSTLPPSTSTESAGGGGGASGGAAGGGGAPGGAPKAGGGAPGGAPRAGGPSGGGAGGAGAGAPGGPGAGAFGSDGNFTPQALGAAGARKYPMVEDVVAINYAQNDLDSSFTDALEYSVNTQLADTMRKMRAA